LSATKPEFRDGLYTLVHAWFEYWQHFGVTPGPEVDALVAEFHAEPESVSSCVDANLAARLAIVRGDRDRAGRFVDYALDKGFYDPRFINFCRRYDLCAAP
jgi:hypothetical protein